MDFFRSVFAEDEPPPSKSNPESSSAQDPTSNHPEQQQSSPLDPAFNHDQPPPELTPPPTPPSSYPGLSEGGWSIGGLMKTFATRSESVIETYRRDLKEFGSGLKKETQSLKEVANRAVKELPPIEINASKAQGAIDSIGSTLWRSTAEILAQGKESLLADEDVASSNDTGGKSGSNREVEYPGGGRYNRFDSQLRAIQGDVHTYIEEPESGGDEYGKWRSEFDLGDKGEEIKGLLRENVAVGEIYKKVVPDSMDHETFWCRYYYQVHRLVQADSARAKLVATSRDDEEELSWDIEDEEVEVEVPKKLENEGSAASVENDGEDVKGRDLSGDLKGKEQNVPEEERKEEVTRSSSGVGDEKRVNVVQVVDNDKTVVEEDTLTERASESKKDETTEKANVNERVCNEKVAGEEAVQEDSVKDNDESTMKSIETVSPDVKAQVEEYGKKSGDLVAPKQQSSQQDEEEFGWDEIEDLGSDDDDKKVAAPKRSSDRAEIRKRLSIADDDEDLSWDIEDDD